MCDTYDWVDDPGVGLDEVLRRFAALEQARTTTEAALRSELDRANAAIARVKTVRDDLYRRPHCADFADQIDIALDGDDDATPCHLWCSTSPACSKPPAGPRYATCCDNNIGT